jgi:hypothetical protein
MNFNPIRFAMKNGNKTKTEYTIGIARLNLIATLVNIPITILFLLAFKYIWGMDVFFAGKALIMEYWIEVLLAGLLVREILHGFVLAIYAERGIFSIRFRYKWQWLIPYCQCKEPLSVRQYRIGAILPFLIFGIIPSLLSIFIGNGALMCFGLFFTWFGAGDIIVFYVLRNLDDDFVVSDHPSKVGFISEMGVGVN